MERAVGITAFVGGLRFGAGFQIELLSLAYYSDDHSWDRGRLARSFGTRYSQGIARGTRAAQGGVS